MRFASKMAASAVITAALCTTVGGVASAAEPESHAPVSAQGTPVWVLPGVDLGSLLDTTNLPAELLKPLHDVLGIGG